MSEADYRLMTDATGQRIAEALEDMYSGENVKTTDIANNLTTTNEGKVLDARQGKALNDKINATQSDIAIIIEGNQTTHTGGAAVGEYVKVRNSTISGITDGLYKAVQAIPQNTAIDSTYLTEVDGGGLNAINSSIAKFISNANGEAWQFDSGLMICKKTVSQAVSWSAWGSLYESSIIDCGSFPINFISIPVVSVTLNNSNVAAWPTGVGSISVSSAGTGRVIRPNDPGTQTITVGIIAIGRWK